MQEAQTYAALLRRRRDDLLDELAGIEATLRRLEQGRFGVCECCGQAISRDRLMQFPATSWCSACKRDYEQRRGIHHTDDAT
ncbi:TraR/DksA family transcriptional regulator [Duganella radicis]|uniref:Zinc finger DksA/TraR C4-type domain-containing protein n=1 Tax=Duganella radicis TaxID=551988 RepID=A0A6L6PDD8_9BURK|nr:TraR/DksA C4-type zinc finger protein [Duganella radicis]MTV36355.1 hypothetical protein [Duganella radicis]